MSFFKKALLFLTFNLTAFAGAAEDGNVAVNGAWIRAMPEESSRTSVYLAIKNTGTKAITLTKIEGDWADSFAIHTTKEVNGFVMMEELEKIEVPAQSSLAFKPGALHIMAEGLKQPLKEGGTHPLALVFDDGKKIQISVPVKKDEHAERM